MSNILYIVVPCYNEQEVLPETSKRLREKVQTLRQSGKIDADSRILFVNEMRRGRWFRSFTRRILYFPA